MFTKIEPCKRVLRNLDSVVRPSREFQAVTPAQVMVAAFSQSQVSRSYDCPDRYLLPLPMVDAWVAAPDACPDK